MRKGGGGGTARPAAKKQKAKAQPAAPAMAPAVEAESVVEPTSEPAAAGPGRGRPPSELEQAELMIDFWEVNEEPEKAAEARAKVAAMRKGGGAR